MKVREPETERTDLEDYRAIEGPIGKIFRTVGGNFGGGIRRSELETRPEARP